MVAKVVDFEKMEAGLGTLAVQEADSVKVKTGAETHTDAKTTRVVSKVSFLIFLPNVFRVAK